MLTSLVISAREFLEMFLIIVPILVYLKKVDKFNLSKFLFIGSFLGLATSSIVGGLILKEVHTIDFAVQEFFKGSLMILMAGLILYNMVLINKDSKKIGTIDENENTVNFTRISLFLLGLITVFRESLEVVLFLLPYFVTFSMEIILGVVIGVVIALAVTFVIFKTSLKISVKLIFNIITVALIILGAMMFGEGLIGIFPAYGDSIEKVGMLVYGIPTLLIFVKKALKKYVKK